MIRKNYILIFWLAPVLAAQHSVELETRYWRPSLDGALRVGRSGIATDIDLRNDLGIGSEYFPYGSATVHRGAHRVRFQFTQANVEGDRDVSRTVIFLNRTYTVGTRVLSEVEVRHFQASWSYQFGSERFRVGPMVEVDGFMLRGSLAAPNLNPPFAERDSQGFGLPAPGVAVDIRPHRAVHVFGEISGMGAGGYGRFIASDAGVRVSWKHLMVTGGYRVLDLHVERSGNFARWRTHGPFVGAGLSF